MLPILRVIGDPCRTGRKYSNGCDRGQLRGWPLSFCHTAFAITDPQTTPRLGSEDTMESISDWLDALDLNRYTQVFAENDIDLEVLPSLSEQDLQSLGVSLGHRKKIGRASCRERVCYAV